MKSFAIKMIAAAVVACLIVFIIQYSNKYPITAACYLGIVFITIIQILLQIFIRNGEKNSPSSAVRRVMLGSTFRMLSAAIFLAIALSTLRNLGESAMIVFAVIFCVYFLFVMILDIKEMRSKLRANSEQGSKNENG